MTLDETIKEAKITVAVYEKEAHKYTQHGGSFYEEKAKVFSESAKEFTQIAEWLEELKAYREADRPQGEWIPCSKRLPKESGQYLVTAGIEQRQVAKGYYSAEYERWYAVSEVSAWMPLPKPWEGADDDL